MLAGGEVAAMVLLEAVVRLIPGVLGGADSHADESFENGLLEYPQYTRPQSFEGVDIPAVLTSGDHGKIARWRAEQSRALTSTAAGPAGQALTPGCDSRPCHSGEGRTSPMVRSNRPSCHTNLCRKP